MTFPELKALADDTAVVVRLSQDTRLAGIVLLDAFIRVYGRAKLEVLDEVEHRARPAACEICGEPAGAGGVLCPACQENQ